MKWFSADKGFGFAVAEDGDKDIFIHISVVEKAGTHRSRLEQLASNKWDNDEYEDVAGMLRLQITAEDLLEG